MRTQHALFERILDYTKQGSPMRAAVDMVIVETLGEILECQKNIEKILTDVCTTPTEPDELELQR